MKAEEWAEFLHTHGDGEWAGGLLQEQLIEDMEGVEGERDENAREAGILRDALAESKRLREKAVAECRMRDEMMTDMANRLVEEKYQRNTAETKVAALTALLAQSSTQYREMVAELDDYKAYYEFVRHIVPEQTVPVQVESYIRRIEARRERSTP